MYICPLYIRCHAPILFTCIAVLSRLVVKGGACVKYGILGRITSCWVGQDKQGRYNIEESWQRAQSNPRTRPEWTYLRGAAQVCIICTYCRYNVAIRMKRKRLGCCELPVPV
jgi:hypothetical protein